jgi:branched-chain amino acid aminotransferase
VPGVVYLDGRFVDPSEAFVPLLDRGYLLSDGGFETVRAYRGVPFALEQHLDRLLHTSSVLGISLPMTRSEIGHRTRETIARSGLSDAYVRITVSRGPGAGGLTTKGAGPTTLSIAALPLRSFPAEAYRDGIETTIVKTRRVPAACLDPSIKSACYLPQIQARRELEALGLMEGVQLSVFGDVVSGTASNLFAVRGTELVTPHLASGCLPGVTRKIVLDLGPMVGLSARESALGIEELLSADEVFFTSTLLELLPVRKLVTTTLDQAPGRWTQKLQGAFREHVERAVGEQR